MKLCGILCEKQNVHVVLNMHDLEIPEMPNAKCFSLSIRGHLGFLFPRIFFSYSRSLLLETLLNFKVHDLEMLLVYSLQEI